MLKGDDALFTLVLLNRYDMSKSPDAYVKRIIEGLVEQVKT